jgi:hypothetical protein
MSPADLEAVEPGYKPRPAKPKEKTDTPAPTSEPEKPQAALPRYMTRREAAKYANEVLGVPVKESTIAKKAMKGAGPKPDRFYGKVELYTPKTIENWVMEELCAARPTKLNAA